MSLPDLTYLTPAQKAAFLQTAALEPPLGLSSNFDSPPNGDAFSIGIQSMCIAISTVLTIVRLYVSWGIFKKFYLGDAFLIIAYGLYIGYYVVVFDSIVKVGYLIHQWDVTYEGFLYLIRSFIITPTLYGISIMFIKTAIVLEWLRIFSSRISRGFFYWGSIAAITINILFYVSVAFIFNLGCRPYERYWNPFIEGTCYYDVFNLDLPAGIINLVVDVMIFILPQKIIWGLNLDVKKRCGVAAIFAVGIFTIVSAICRVVWTVWLIQSDDITYRISALGLWVNAEMTCGFIVFCVPSVPKAIGHLDFSGLSTSFKSWTRFSQRKRKTTDTDTSWASQNSYQNIDGNKSVPLQAVEDSTWIGPRGLPAQYPPSGPHDLNILRTTQVIRRSEDIPGIVPELGHHSNRQDPWNNAGA